MFPFFSRPDRVLMEFIEQRISPGPATLPSPQDPSLFCFSHSQTSHCGPLWVPLLSGGETIDHAAFRRVSQGWG